MCVQICSLKISRVGQWYWQWGQENGFWTAWVRRCLLRLPFVVKLKGHWQQMYGFSRAWLRMCLLRLSLLHVWNKHMGQEYGFSPVWVRLWLIIWESLVVVYVQYGHFFIFFLPMRSIPASVTPSPSVLGPSLSVPTCWGRIFHLLSKTIYSIN